MITTNAPQVLGNIISRLNDLKPGGAIANKVLRTVAFTTQATMSNRIHEKGEKADGSQIGTYHEPYLSTRQRAPYNLVSSTKMIFYLTGDLERGFVAMENGDQYAVGFKDDLSAKKAEGLQKGNRTLKGFGEVYALTTKERDDIIPIAEEVLHKEFNS